MLLDRKKNLIILISILILILSGFLFYLNYRITKLQNLLFRNLESNQQEGKSRPNDFYKDVAVKNALRKKEDEFHKCYQQYLKSARDKFDGFVEVDWTILEDGSVDRPERVSSDMNSESLHECILLTISKMEFPPTPTGFPIYTTHKFNFRNYELNPSK